MDATLALFYNYNEGNGPDDINDGEQDERNGKDFFDVGHDDYSVAKLKQKPECICSLVRFAKVGIVGYAYLQGMVALGFESVSLHNILLHIPQLHITLA